MIKYICVVGLSFISLATYAQNKVFHTKFDNGQAQDISGNGHHGTLVGGPTACPGAAGIANTALYFDGINDFVQLPTDTAFDLTKWTLHAIVKPQGFNSTTCQASGIIWHDQQWSNKFYGLYICDNWYDADCATDSDMEAFGGLATGSSSTPDYQSPWYTANGYVHEDEWYCVVLTYDGAMMKLYVNGELIESDVYQSSYNHNAPSPTYIGNGPQTGYEYWFKGVIDEVSIWDDAVTLNQVTGSLCDSFLIATDVAENISMGSRMEVYPSPAANTLSLDASDHWKGANWAILNMTGQVIAIGSIGKNAEIIDVSALSSGVYIIRAQNANGTETRKFIKE